jgi:hypothetical protein
MTAFNYLTSTADVNLLRIRVLHLMNTHPESLFTAYGISSLVRGEEGATAQVLAKLIADGLIIETQTSTIPYYALVKLPSTPYMGSNVVIFSDNSDPRYPFSQTLSFEVSKANGFDVRLVRTASDGREIVLKSVYAPITSEMIEASQELIELAISLGYNFVRQFIPPMRGIEVIETDEIEVIEEEDDETEEAYFAQKEAQEDQENDLYEVVRKIYISALSDLKPHSLSDLADYLSMEEDQILCDMQYYANGRSIIAYHPDGLTEFVLGMEDELLFISAQSLLADEVTHIYLN